MNSSTPVLQQVTTRRKVTSLKIKKKRSRVSNLNPKNQKLQLNLLQRKKKYLIVQSELDQKRA
jgi:hypothetical protein